jgi:thymidylate synthase
MATLIHGKTGRLAYPEIVRTVAQHGVPRFPRGLETRDLGHVTIHLESGRDALPVGCGRSLNTRIAAAEAVQLIGGYSDPALMMYASENFKRFTESDGTFWGAYGERVGRQVSEQVKKLIRDPSTRQAVVTLWDSDLDNQADKADYPCTVGFGFTYRKGFLDMNVVMRSNDVWLGLPYDMFQFTQLQQSVAHCVGAATGTYTHTAWSLHIYREHYDAATRLFDPPTESGLLWKPAGIGTPGDPWRKIEHRASHIAYDVLPDLTDSEIWYRKQFEEWAR